jgi:hypothetical protein
MLNKPVLPAQVIYQVLNDKPYAAEIPAKQKGCRAWVIIHKINQHYALPDSDRSAEFVLRWIEIDHDLVRRHWEENLDIDFADCTESEVTLLLRNELESALAQRIDDFDLLVPVWKTEYPF